MAARLLLMRAVAITTWHSSASRSRPKTASFWEGQAWGGQVQMKYGKGVFAGAVTAVLGVRAATAQVTDTASAGNGGVATAAPPSRMLPAAITTWLSLARSLFFEHVQGVASVGATP